VSGLHAVRVAAMLRRELGIEVTTEEGHYGQFTVLVDGDVAIDAGPLAAIGVVPSDRAIRSAVTERLART